MKELRKALRQMAKGKCADKIGIVLEMFVCGGDRVHEMFLFFLNDIVLKRTISTDWYKTYFSLLPKRRDGEDPSTWKLIAVLSIS